MSSKKMLGVLFMQNGMTGCLIALGGLVAFIVLGIAVDLRFFILALVWLFMIIPMIIAFLYFFYGMKPLTAFNTIPHTIKFNDDNLDIKFFTPTPDSDKLEDTHKDYTVSKHDFSSIKSGGDYVLIESHKYGWLWLPVYAFDSYDDFKTNLESLRINNSPLK